MAAVTPTASRPASRCVRSRCAVAQRRHAREEHGRDSDRDQQQDARPDRGGGVVAGLAAREREPRDEQVARRERGERRQPDRGAGVRQRRPSRRRGRSASRRAREQPAERQQRDERRSSAVAAATPSITAPTLPPASADHEPQRRAACRRTAAWRRRARGSGPRPAARPRRPGSTSAIATVAAVAAIASGSSSPTRRRDRDEHRREHEQRGRPDAGPSGACRAGRRRRPPRRPSARLEATLRAVVAWKASGGTAPIRTTAKSAASSEYSPRSRIARERELEHGVERVREPDGEREQEPRPDQRPPGPRLLGGPVGGHRHRSPPGCQSGSALARRGVRSAREDEQQIGEPVQVDERERVDLHALGGGERLALGPAADGARDAAAAAAASVPPGRTKLFSGSRAALNRSQSASSRVDARLLDPEPVRRPRTAPRGRRRGRRARSGPRRARRAARVRARRRARARAAS